MSTPEHTRRACPACGDSTRLYRDVEQVWNQATGEWEFAGTLGKADCSTCDWSGTEDETEGPLCQGCGKPEAACSENPCAAVAADRDREAADRGIASLYAWAEWYRRATSDDDCQYLNSTGWKDAATLAKETEAALAAARGEG